jgi:hypothetical protein
MLVCVKDESPAGQSLHEMALEFLSERITVRELLRERVYHEVREFNRHEDKTVFTGLVQPGDTEQFLNGQRPEYRLKAHRIIDWEAQFSYAQEAFAKNGFFILIDDKQAESLDQEFVIGPMTNVIFVKLVPLVGG